MVTVTERFILLLDLPFFGREGDDMGDFGGDFRERVGDKEKRDERERHVRGGERWGEDDLGDKDR